MDLGGQNRRIFEVLGVYFWLVNRRRENGETKRFAKR